MTWRWRQTLRRTYQSFFRLVNYICVVSGTLLWVVVAALVYGTTKKKLVCISPRCEACSVLIVTTISAFPLDRPGEGRELDGTQEEVHDGHLGGDEERGIVEEDEGPWYMGKAREEFHRRRRGKDAGRPGGEEEDPIQVCFDDSGDMARADHRCKYLVGKRTQKCRK